MDLSQKQNTVQTMRQEQVMTHQQIQALEMLFLPVLELQTMINEEISKNPVIDSEAPDDLPDNPIDSASDDWLDKILKLEEEKRYIRTSSVSRYSEDDEEKRLHYLESITEEKTFQQLLLEQLRFLDMEPTLHACCEVVISGLDDNGYLSSHPADLAMASGQSLELVKKAIEIVQKLDPPGVAASDLRERLLIQLSRKGLEDTRAYEAVRDYLDEIAANHIPQVARKMKISLDEIKEVITCIQGLSPMLSSESVSPHEYVREEVEVIEEVGELKVKMKNDYLPSLYISKNYREILNDPSATKETKDYIKEKIHSGVFLINSIIQRQTTIRKIVGALVEFQSDFFKNGIENLKPMTMAQIAEKAGIHETTVSRAAAGKYIRCKYGLLSLRGFFSTGYESDDGKSVSKDVVKNAIKLLIDSEDAVSPLSDSDIAGKLKPQGYKVARRTVAKYRESMNILPSNLRRRY
ncbi:MAG: RNA polymerase sigma-54 factor [Lentisphaerae bacterium GWF2_45_14]|nr:MAG: RNA polymerase sigma-54 factor [Lentisphaerae bacterium GWF2_45_14]